MQTKHTTPSLELHLETLEVRIGLQRLDKTTLERSPKGTQIHR
jgi:hypothetical protein